MPKKYTNTDIQEMLQEGNLIARSLYVGRLQQTPEGTVTHDFAEFDKEMQFLHSERRQDGIHSNVERSGQRNRSASLIVPEVPMDLFVEVGLLYNADQSTVRGYMYHDSATTSGTNHHPEKFFNISEDKAKFQPIRSKKEFLDKYKQYRAETDRTAREHTKYNEILANFFPESIAGLVAQTPSIENKILLLEAKQLLSEKYGLDLPMVIMEQGRVNTWTPNLTEVSELLNASKESIERLSVNSNRSKEELLQKFCSNLGFGVEVKDFAQTIRPQDITVLNKNELTSKELIKFMYKVTDIPEGGKFSYGITGRLQAVVNKRLESEGLKKINNLEEAIISKEDIANLVNALQEEVASKNPAHKKMNERELSKFCDSVMSRIHDSRIRPKSQELDIEDIKKTLAQHIPGNEFSKPREFFNKVTSLVDRRRNENTNTKDVVRAR
jgi:hypothetical protein